MKKQAGLLGLVAAGAAVGLAAERYAIGRARLRPDPDAREPFFGIAATSEQQVAADDGVLLHVETVDGPADLTVVFCHGYTQQKAVWHYQRQAFREDPPARLVFWDQRSHGKSGRGSAESAQIDQLGRDLFRVLEATAPTGPVVLVGHSMGGMTVMALADSHPELFAERVVGVALIGTSAGKLAEVTFGLPKAVSPFTKLALPFLTRGMHRRPGAFERGRTLGTDLAYVLSRRIAFGSGEVSPSVVEFVERMTAETPVDVIADFYDTFMSHDKLEALPVLDGVETLVLCGTEDRLTPVEHSRAIASLLPDAQLVVVEGAGHMVMLERPPLVTLHLRALLSRARLRVAAWTLAELALGISSCTQCPELVAERTRVVPGQFPGGARLLVVGEAPGAQEDEVGEPFVGKSGQLLDLLLTEVGGSRARTAVLNTLKCRPPGNRPPKPVESRNCKGWTEQQLDLAAPDLIVTLGLSAAKWFLGPCKLGDVRGRVHEVAGRRVLPTYHPSAAIRFGPNGEPRRLLREDLATAVGLTT